MSLTIFAPLTGWVAPLSEVPDAVFADRILGDGVAIDPTAGEVLAPCAGIVSALAKHAVTIRAENGAEILIHIGLETVALNGQGFTAQTELGRVVKPGDILLSFDLNFLAKHAKSLITPVILANGEAVAIQSVNLGREMMAGEALFEIVPLAAANVTSSSAAQTASRKARVASEHGLHARPSALLAGAAKAFVGEVTLSCHGRNANAKSAVAIMALGVQCQDEVELTATGDDAEALVIRLSALLAEVHQEKKAAVVPTAVSAKNTATKLFGVRAAPGRVVGTAVSLRSADLKVCENGVGIVTETQSLRKALADFQNRLVTSIASAKGAQRDILSAHLELLTDPELEAAALKDIEHNKSAAYSWRKAVRAYADIFRGLEDSRMRERAADLMDIERQMLALLLDGEATPRALPPSAILLADEILPSDLSAYPAMDIAGLLSAHGGPTSHVAILAAAMNIPALVGVGDAVLAIADGAEILLDADGGFADLAPDAAIIAAVRKAAQESSLRAAREQAEAAELCFTADGLRLEVFANLGKGAEEAAAAVAYGAEGCGLLRTEFLFMERETAPSEAEQLSIYQSIADALSGRSFILRTFDIGADKPVAYLTFPHEDNPQLGLRGVRAGLAWPELLKTQLRAAAQIKPAGICKILLPMINAVGELRAVRTMLSEICNELSLPVPPLGVMIETPSSALLAEQLIKEADFFSIGTNDLTQYTLAIDRTHGTLSKELDALHPAVLRLIARTAEAANNAGKFAAICGGLAADPVAAPILIGLGIKELSAPAPAIPRLKAQIRSLRMGECHQVALAALACESAAAVRALATISENRP